MMLASFVNIYKALTAVINVMVSRNNYVMLFLSMFVLLASVGLVSADVEDAFDRADSSSLGTATNGNAWVLSDAGTGAYTGINDSRYYFHRNGSSGNSGYRLVLNSTDPSRFDFSVNITSLGSSTSYFQLSKIESCSLVSASSDCRNVEVVIDSAGEVKYRNSGGSLVSLSTATTLSTNQVYDISLRNIDLGTDTYDIYIDDVIKQSGASFYRATDALNSTLIAHSSSRTIFIDCIATNGDNCGAAPSYFTVSVTDSYTGASINNVTATVNGTYYANATGNTIYTNINVSVSTPVVNVTVNSTNYYYAIYNNYNTSNDLSATLDKYFYLYNVSYDGFFTYNGTGYVRELEYSLNYTCNSDYSAGLVQYVNDGVYAVTVATCNNATSTTTGTYNHSVEGNYTIFFMFNASFLPGLNNENSTEESYVSDLYSPSVNLSWSYNEGFVDPSVNVTLVCTDSIYPISFYNMSINGASLFTGNLSNGTEQTNSSELETGTNNAYGACSDAFGTNSTTLSDVFYVRELILIDEQENVAFDVSNITRARVYYDDNSTFHTFTGTAGINFTSTLTNKLRFELVYVDGTIITRWVDTELSPNPLRVCANKDGVTHYEQLIIAATQQPAVLKSVFSNCLVAADYTRFAYQDAFLLKAYTINSLYYLYTYQGDEQTLLASVDGSVSSFINLDTLEFASGGYNLQLLQDAMSFQRLDNKTVQIYYENIANDSTALSLSILRLDTNTVVFSSSDFTNPNKFTLYFNWATLSPAVNDSTLFKLTLTKTNSAGTESFNRYFNAKGGSGSLNAGFAFVISLLVMLFGFTFAISRITFGWFGIFIALFALAITSFSVQTWYILMLQMLEVVVLVYTGILLWQQNYPVVT